MRFDIRLPIGALFFVVGVMLVGYGMLSDRAIYARSLGYNVNMWWGLVLLVFGAVFIFFGRRAPAPPPPRDLHVPPEPPRGS